MPNPKPPEYQPPRITPIEPPRVRYFGPFSKPTGYAQAGHDYLAALHALGVDLDIWLQMPGNSDDLPARYHHLLPLVDREDAPEPTHVIVHTIPTYAADHVLPEAEAPPDVPCILMTTWETTKIASDVAESLNEAFDLVIVPSEFNRDAFLRSGVKRVVAVPHTFDPAAWPMAPVPLSRPFCFYTVGVWGDRKNLMGLLKAYLSAFRSGDDVILRVCSPYVPEEEIHDLVGRMGLHDLPRLEFVGTNKRLTEEELYDLHRTSHCYVSATRGEAWGLGAFEAALMGNPVIMPGFGGQTDFLRHYRGWSEVPYFLTPAIAHEVQAGTPFEVAGMRFTPRITSAPNGIAADQHWAEPDLCFLQQAMQSVSRAVPGLFRNVITRKGVEGRFGYRPVGMKLIAALVYATKIRRAREQAAAGAGDLPDGLAFDDDVERMEDAWNNDLKENA